MSKMSGDSGKKNEEDRHLKNWSSWLKKWDSVGGLLSTRLDVRSENLLMNYGDDIRKINLEKSLLEYVKIPTEFDKYRGNPDFWKLPWSLAKRCICLPTEPTYFAVKSKEERNEVPEIEFIANPDHVTVFEKNILLGARNIYERWQTSKYRKTQLERFASKIGDLVPHVPHVSNLIVIGKHFGATKDQQQKLEEPQQPSPVREKSTSEAKIVRSAPSLTTATTSMTSAHKRRLSFVVNGIRLDEISCSDDTVRKLRIYFEFDIKTKTSNVKHLFFSNNGSATLRLSWKKMKKFQILRNYTSTHIESYGFYFDKNDLVLLPGARTEVPVWFVSEVAGTFSESWELVMRPEISGSFRLVVLFHCFAYFGDLKLKVDNLVTYMDVQLRNCLIRDILNEIVHKVRYEETPIVSCVYDESHLFEIANLSNGRPFFLFDEVIVDELKLIFKKLTADGNWNYSVKYLEKLAQSKDIAVFLENKKAEVAEIIAEKIRNEEAERQAALKKLTDKSESGKKAKGRKDKKGKKKKGSSKSDKKSRRSSKKSKKTEEPKSEEEPEVEVFKKENYIYTNQLELWNVVKKLESPVIINRNREKYFSCTKVMSAYFSKMCNMLESLEHEYEIIRTSRFPDTKYTLVPIGDLPERLVYEYYEDDYLSNKVLETYPLGAKRKPKILRDIPSEDIETIYETYFNIPRESKEKGKKSKSKKKKGKEKSPKSPKKQKEDKKSKKGKKGDKGSKKETGKIVDKPEMSVESFNPYVEQFVYVPELEQAETPSLLEDEIPLTQRMKEDYKYRQYITVYSCLSEAVDALVDTLESFDCVVSHSTLNEMKICFPDSLEEKQNEQD